MPSPINTPAGCRFKGRCRYHKDTCDEQPALVEVKPGHFVACHSALSLNGLDTQAGA